MFNAIFPIMCAVVYYYCAWYPFLRNGRYVSLLILMQNNFTTAHIIEKIALTKYYQRYYSILPHVFIIIKIWSIFFRPAFISISIVDLNSYASGLHQCQRLQDISTLDFSTMNFQPLLLLTGLAFGRDLRRSLNM